MAELLDPGDLPVGGFDEEEQFVLDRNYHAKEVFADIKITLNLLMSKLLIINCSD